jgi:hypothetical protein
MVLAAYLSVHKTMINGGALCAAWLSRNVTDLFGLAAAEPSLLIHAPAIVAISSKKVPDGASGTGPGRVGAM